MDVRDHADSHRAALDDIADAARARRRSTATRCARELLGRRPLVGAHVPLDDATRARARHLPRRAHDPGRDGRGGGEHVHRLDDARAPTTCCACCCSAREAGLVDLAADPPESRIDVVPLFETLDDLERAPDGDARAARRSGLRAPARRARQPAGSDDRLLRLGEGRRHPRGVVGAVSGAGGARGAVPRGGRRAAALSRPRRQRRARRRLAGVSRARRAAARHGERPHQDHRAGRDHLAAVRAAAGRRAHARGDARRRAAAGVHRLARRRSTPREIERVPRDDATSCASASLGVYRELVHEQPGAVRAVPRGDADRRAGRRALRLAARVPARRERRASRASARSRGGSAGRRSA